jgi:hypothetical protein
MAAEITARLAASTRTAANWMPAVCYELAARKIDQSGPIRTPLLPRGSSVRNAVEQASKA